VPTSGLVQGRRLTTEDRYFFAATNYFLYGESLIYYFKHILTQQTSFLPTTFSFAQHHRLISFGLYVIGESTHTRTMDVY
jgi:phosphatidate cytidylyltransferase